ncbi:hypothetical protein AHML_09220 [Aeromonas hydrophila ML09-119]|nr:hypothetical protein AHML_09220 [Aeromonas hydrophila ML09-119]ODM29412.1 hypothetical protein A7J16_17320 [Aeromonas hydrophila]
MIRPESMQQRVGQGLAGSVDARCISLILQPLCRRDHILAAARWEGDGRLTILIKLPYSGSR